MNVVSIFPGSFYVTDGENSLLAGCPPEIVKVLRQKGLKSPHTILLPDLPISHGESQVAVEFPLYHHLFFGGRKNPKPLLLVGNERRVKAARELVRISLLGPDVAQMEEWGMPALEAEALGREIRWLAPKAPTGKPLAIDEIISTKVIGDQELNLKWIKIRRTRTNVFQLTIGKTTETIDLTVLEEQTPPYPVTTDLTVTKLVKLGVEVLGGATGFSSTQPCSGLALCYNGNYILIDAIPYLNFHLKARGIARNQVHSVFLSHIHDDHCNLVSLLQYNRRIQILTTPVVYRMMLQKLALTLDRPEESLAEYFTFLPLKPGEAKNFFGLHVHPFWACHSIPTVGAQFETMHSGIMHRITFTGDTLALDDIKKMQTSGAITNERYTEMADLYRRAANILIADGGEGVLHGCPADAMQSPAERIVFMHLDNLSPEFQVHFTVASSGKRFNVLEGETDYNLTRTIEFLLEYFPTMPPVWISNLLANQKVFSYNAGDIIIREGSRSEGHVYMILTGYAQVVSHGGGKKQVLAQMEAGELIGEMSVMTGRGTRNASVVALSPVTVTAFSEEAFRGYIEHQGQEGNLKRMWQSRQLLQNFPYLRPLQQPVIRALSAKVSLESLLHRNGEKSLETITESGSLIFPLGEEVELRQNKQTRAIPAQSAPILVMPGATLVTESELQFLLLRAPAAAELRNRIPAFRYFWEETLGLPVPAATR